MPNIIVKVPKKILDSQQITSLGREITKAAHRAEGIPDDPAHHRLTWVMVEEVEASHIFVAGNEVVPKAIPIIVMFYPPQNVLDSERREIAAREVHIAILKAAPEELHQRIASSCMIFDVPEGNWGGNGEIWTLDKISAIAGYEHL
jgi:phenylpyruvate tautomerase PptA (4-oxalocrotonate tautomerase family)